MKTLKIILFAIIVSIPDLQAQDDPVQWMHGFQGDAPGRWKIYEALFERERELISQTPDYSHPDDMDNGISNAARVVEQQIGGSNNLLIAHSMGGIVAREMERRGNADIDGIVTVGTCNQGAIAAKSLRQDLIMPAFESGLNTLLKGPGSSVIGSIGGSVSVNLTASGISQKIWRGLVIDGVREALPNANSQTITDLMPNSNLITSLNRTGHSAPVINIITREDNNEALRMGTTALNSAEDDPLHQHDDTRLIDIKNDAVVVYKGFEDYYNVKRFLMPLLYGSYSNKMKNYRAGKNYLRSQFETIFEQIIGANYEKTVTRTGTRWVCNNTDLPTLSKGQNLTMTIDPMPTPSDCEENPNSSECNDCGYVTYTYTENVTVREANDGLIPVSTQTIPNLSFNDIYQAKEVNHLEVGNHPNMTAIMNDIFDRDREVFTRKKR